MCAAGRRRPGTAAVAGQGTTAWTWDAAGQFTGAAHPNGSSEARTWDRDGRLDLVTVTDSASAIVGSHDYAYDTAGRPTSETTPTDTLFHDYDERGRLTETCRQATPCTGTTDPFTRWTYDGVGNRLTETTPAGTDVYVYDDDSRLASVTGTGPAAGSYAWNRNGQRTSDPSRTYMWRQDGLMASVSDGATTWEYGYAPDGTRTGIATGVLPTDTRNVAWDRNGMPRAVSEHDGSNTLLNTWSHGATGVLSESDGMATAWHHGNMIGSSATVTGPAGLAGRTARWGPWGSLEASANPDPAVPAQSAGWAGEPDLAGAELMHLRARDYDPATGQFVSVDPLLMSTGEPYAYASGAPTALTDPLGLCSVGGVRIGFMSNADGACKGSGTVRKYGDDLARLSANGATVTGVICLAGVAVSCGISLVLTGTSGLASTVHAAANHESGWDVATEGAMGVMAFILPRYIPGRTSFTLANRPATYRHMWEARDNVAYLAWDLAGRGYNYAEGQMLSTDGLASQIGKVHK